MQMWPCRPPGLADIGNDFVGFDLLPCCDADARAVGVEGGQPFAVVEFDVVAVAAAPTVHTVGDHYRTVCGGKNGCAVGHGDVSASVIADFPGEGVGAVALGRGGHADHRKWPLQRAIAQFAPERGGVLGREQGQVLVLVGVEAIFLAHFLGCFMI